MTLVREKYKVLAPRAEYLQDVVVLAQAWKKAHGYIRRHNWYADTLELDCSAVNLESKLEKWSASLKEQSYCTTPACLVPAPKNGPWVFNADLPGGWGPRKEEPAEPQPVLRPLAHIGIREQTVATAVMLCLADCIETAQGNPAEPPLLASDKGVFSYGNRLYCNWSDGGTRARFAWGNATTYSRYFQDYQRFVERPNIVARRVDIGFDESSKVYVVKLDLSAFYDNIDASRLMTCLKREYAAFRKSDKSLPAADSKFWSLARKAVDFGWREEDRELGYLFRGGELPTGLPQGMVASGFLANAYLLEFDRAVGAEAKEANCIGTDSLVQIHDYCRYVDDLRLVVSSNIQEDAQTQICEIVGTWVQKVLSSATTTRTRPLGLQINERKTEVEPLGAVGGDSGIAARMKLMQNQLSGPFDIAALQHVEAGLNGLLALAELGVTNASSALDTSALPSLASIAKPKLEVRDDTLMRFSAYRLTRVLRLRRSMTDLTEQVPDGGTAEKALQHDFELAARRLVSSWSTNPSLVQVLRYALDLFPSPELLAPIASALLGKLESEAGDTYEKRVAFYVLAEIFKAGATETGLRATQDTIFPIGDVPGYRKALSDLAQTLLESHATPWYLQQQASLLLGALGQATRSLPQRPELLLHRALHDHLHGESKLRELPYMDEVAVSLVGYQMRADKKAYASWFRRFVKGRSRSEVTGALELIGQTNQPLFIGLIKPGRGRAAIESELIPGYLSEFVDAQWPENSPALESKKWISFARVITHPSAILNQENSLLQLALALTTLPEKILKRPQQLTPSALWLYCDDWSRLKDPSTAALRVKFEKPKTAGGPTYETPSWCSPDKAWMYAFGRLLRASATGELDFTARNWLLREDVGWYCGIRSSWQTRRTGMLHTSMALVGTTAAITPWFSELLLRLLRWPGIAVGLQVSEFEAAQSLSKFAVLVQSRIDSQKLLYGLSSDIPVYRYPVTWKLKGNRKLRIVQIQGLMPANTDFDDGLNGFFVPGYRQKHRNHTASLLHLAYRKIMARGSVLGVQHKPEVDVVVFPELSVHVDDQDLMRAFSDATGAMLFYGLLGATVSGASSPVNAARWLVPQIRGGRRSWVEVDQGKWHLTAGEKKLGIQPWRPHQVVIELCWNDELGYRISGAICYDATDIALAADLKNESHMFVVSAMNKDVKTFDSMVSALRYHMYQHVIVVNSGEFGGSTAQAPYDQEHKRLISHTHGSQQIAVSIFDICVDDFGALLTAAGEGVAVKKNVKERIGKTPPAGLNRR